MPKTRLDLYVAAAEGITRSAAQRLIEEENVKVNGKVENKNYKVEDGDEVVINRPEPKPCGVEPEDIPLDILYEDSDLLVVSKPKGMVVHPAPGNPNGTLVNALLFHCGADLSSGGDSEYEDVGSFTGIGGVLRPGIVHRIDRDTSGLLVVAKNDSAHLFLSDQLKERKMGRIYETVVFGNVREDKFTVDMPIGRHPTDRKKMAVVSNGRNAVTHGEVIRRFFTSEGTFTHLRLKLETGRTHQIRVHMAKKGHPVIGDTVYGGDHSKFAQRNAGILCGQCLHARTLEIVHPKSGEVMSFDGGLPDYFTAILKKLDSMDQK